jgi:hypothetical protein
LDYEEKTKWPDSLEMPDSVQRQPPNGNGSTLTVTNVHSEEVSALDANWDAVNQLIDVLENCRA